MLCVYTGHLIRDGQLLIAAMEAQGWSGTIRIQKRGHPLTSASLQNCFAFKVFSFTSDLRAAMWSLNGRQPWRLLGGMKVYTHLDAAPSGEVEQRAVWTAGLSARGYALDCGPPLAPAALRLLLSRPLAHEDALARAWQSAERTLHERRIPPWTCTMGGFPYIKDNRVRVALVPAEEHAHLLRDARGCSKLSEEQALSLVADRWGAPTGAHQVGASAGSAHHEGSSRLTQHRTHPRQAPVTLPPLFGESGEGVGRTEVQARFDILAVAFEERFKILTQTQAEAAAQTALAKAAETAVNEAAQQGAMHALRQQQQAESDRMEAMLTRLGSVETQLNATQQSTDLAAAGQSRLLTMLDMQQTLLARLCQSADDTQRQLRLLSGVADMPRIGASLTDSTDLTIGDSASTAPARTQG